MSSQRHDDLKQNYMTKNKTYMTNESSYKNLLILKTIAKMAILQTVK